MDARLSSCNYCVPTSPRCTARQPALHGAQPKLRDERIVFGQRLRLGARHKKWRTPCGAKLGNNFSTGTAKANKNIPGKPKQHSILVFTSSCAFYYILTKVNWSTHSLNKNKANKTEHAGLPCERDCINKPTRIHKRPHYSVVALITNTSPSHGSSMGAQVIRGVNQPSVLSAHNRRCSKLQRDQRNTWAHDSHPVTTACQHPQGVYSTATNRAWRGEDRI